MNNKQMYDEAYSRIKQKVMDDMGYDEEDMYDGSIEDDVNKETDAQFIEEFGFDYIDLLFEENEPIGIDEEEWKEEDLDWLLNDNDEDDEDF